MRQKVKEFSALFNEGYCMNHNFHDKLIKREHECDILCETVHDALARNKIKKGLKRKRIDTTINKIKRRRREAQMEDRGWLPM